MSYTTKVYKDEGGDRQVVASGGQLVVESGAILAGALLSKRVRATAAEVNAGLVILPALDGYKYRLVDVTMIAIGGDAATATSVDIVATQGGSAVRPVVALVAALTRSAIAKPNSANVSVLADGASFAACDEKTAISVAKQAAAGDLATATHIDVILDYVIEVA